MITSDKQALEVTLKYHGVGLPPTVAIWVLKRRSLEERLMTLPADKTALGHALIQAKLRFLAFGEIVDLEVAA
jgi:hypothetical protein